MEWTKLVIIKFLFLLIIFQRLFELVIAKSNEKWMKARGGIETGQGHYKWFVILHILFFISIISEVIFNDAEPQLSYPVLAILLFIQLFRVWCMQSLGRFWNTKIIVLPGVALIRKGPYKYMKHPNYFIVGLELFVIPLLFGAYITSIIFPVLHILLLMVRIPSENKLLAKAQILK